MPDPDLSLLIGRLRSHARLDERELRLVSGLPWRVSRRRRHAYLIRQGDMVADCMVLLSGCSHSHKDLSDGRRQIIGFNYPGDPVDLDLLYLKEAHFGVQMTSEGLVASVSHAALEALMLASPEIQRAFLTTAMVDRAISQEWILNVGRRDARQRIAYLICEAMVRNMGHVDDVTDFRFPFTQEQLGEAAGITQVHVNRVFRQLAMENLVMREGRKLKVPDFSALCDVADMDFRPFYRL